MADVNKPHAVAALIDAVKDARQWSDTDIVDRASKQGCAMSKSNISRLRLQPIKTLSADQVRALASGLDLPLRQVIAAFLTAMGLPANEEPVTIEGALRRGLYPEQVRLTVHHLLSIWGEKTRDNDMTLSRAQHDALSDPDVSLPLAADDSPDESKEVEAQQGEP